MTQPQFRDVASRKAGLRGSNNFEQSLVDADEQLGNSAQEVLADRDTDAGLAVSANDDQWSEQPRRTW